MSGSDRLDGWERLGAVAAGDLTPARLELQWAAQAVAAVGASLAPARDDDSHTSLSWSEEHRALAGTAVRAARELRAALRPEDLTLLLLEASGGITGELPLRGRTLRDGLGWLAENLARPGAGPPQLRTPEHDLPDHPAGRGEPFAFEAPEAGAELGRWFANADRLLRDLREGREHASPVRCWPHHFDIAFLLLLDPDEPDAGKARSVGAGLSPGDASYAEPYGYVTPWPYPEGRDLPRLEAGGHWHTEGFTAAVLTGSDLVASGGAGAQAAAAAAFARSALRACLGLLGER